MRKNSFLSVLLLSGGLLFAGSNTVQAQSHHKLEKRELKRHQEMERDFYGNSQMLREHQRQEKRELKRHQQREKSFASRYAYPYGYDRYPRVFENRGQYRNYYYGYPNARQRHRIYIWP